MTNKQKLNSNVSPQIRHAEYILKAVAHVYKIMIVIFSTPIE